MANAQKSARSAGKKPNNTAKTARTPQGKNTRCKPQPKNISTRDPHRVSTTAMPNVTTPTGQNTGMLEALQAAIANQIKNLRIKLKTDLTTVNERMEQLKTVSTTSQRTRVTTCKFYTDTVTVTILRRHSGVVDQPPQPQQATILAYRRAQWSMVPEAPQQHPAPASVRFSDAYEYPEEDDTYYGQYNNTIDDNGLNTDRAEVINKLLVAAGTALSKKRGKPKFQSHMYVIRGEKRGKISIGDATLPE